MVLRGGLLLALVSACFVASAICDALRIKGGGPDELLSSVVIFMVLLGGAYLVIRHTPLRR